jgi:hypothetical protein
VIRRTLPLAAAVLLGSIVIPRAATAGDVALAEALFRQGRQLMDKGDYAAACPKLKESFAQDEATGTLLALALCQEQAGQTASAWATYAEVVTRARRDGRADREQAALEQLQGLDPKLSRLTIEVDPSLLSVAGVVVKRDGLPIGTGAWGVASPVDPGVHVVEATAPGKRSWKASVTIKPVADRRWWTRHCRCRRPCHRPNPLDRRLPQLPNRRLSLRTAPRHRKGGRCGRSDSWSGALESWDSA